MVSPLHCSCPPVADARFDPGGSVTPTEAVVEALAAAEGVDPLDVDPLYESVSSDVLDSLAGETRRSTTLRFEANGWNVFVRSDGLVRVCDPDRAGAVEPVFER